MRFGIRIKLKCYDYFNVYAALLTREMYHVLTVGKWLTPS